MMIRLGSHQNENTMTDPTASTPQLTEAARALASLALARVEQQGSLGLRQGQQLRRALATAGDALEWDLIQGTDAARTSAAIQDVARLADEGTRLLDRELAELLVMKRGEIRRIEAVARSVHELAADSTVAYPTDVEYTHTARNSAGEFVTKTETLTLKGATEATTAAARLEKRLERLAKLRDQMLEELQRQRRQVRTTRHDLPDFVESSRRVVGELLTLAS